MRDGRVGCFIEQPVNAVKMSGNEIQSDFPTHETAMSLIHFCFPPKLP
jgi:hypothetical protein